MNKIQIKGFVGNIQPLRTVGNRNTPLLNFSVGTSRLSKRPNQQTGQQAEFETTWHNVTVWGDKANELVNNGIQKGSKVFVEGRQDNYTYTDKQGNEVPATRIIATDVEVLIHVKKSPQTQAPAQGGYQQPQGGYQQPQGGYPQQQPQQQPAQQGYAPPQQPAQQQQQWQDPDDDLPF